MKEKFPSIYKESIETLQINIGSEDDFVGVVDLINFKGIVWNEDDMGMTYEEVEIPADIIDEARDYRGKLLEAVAEFDDNLLEKYFEDENSLTEQAFIKNPDSKIKDLLSDNKILGFLRKKVGE